MTILTPVGTDRAAWLSIGTPADRSHQALLALMALGQLERDLQRLSRALAPLAAPAEPRSRPRVVRWPRVPRSGRGYPAL
jgi:hypothetical protein